LETIPQSTEKFIKSIHPSTLSSQTVLQILPRDKMQLETKPYKIHLKPLLTGRTNKLKRFLNAWELGLCFMGTKAI
jgi:hypothetical protein